MSEFEARRADVNAHAMRHLELLGPTPYAFTFGRTFDPRIDDRVSDLGARFAARTLPKAEWTHAAHLTVGLWHVHHFGSTAALPMLRDGIGRLNDSHGTANTTTGGYHETITAAYVRLIAAYLAASDASVPLATHVDRLLADPLADRDALLRYYSRDLLMSPHARLAWAEPDRAALP
jgi:hypothetical protein